jgi:hypothetical protein
MPRHRKKPLSPVAGERERFLRSINIVLDAQTADTIGHFRPTAKAIPLIQTVVGAANEKCVFVVAPYGSGKSLAAAFAIHLVENRPESRECLTALSNRFDGVSREFGAKLRNRIEAEDTQGMGLPLYGHVRSVPEALKGAILSAVERLGLKSCARAINECDCSRSDRLNLFLDQAGKILLKAGLDRVAIVWDEFGKHLETLISEGRSSDLIDLQILAEYCARTKPLPITLTVLMHQGLLRYGVKLPQTVRLEWAKIEGRFKTIQYVDTSRTIYQLICDIALDLRPINLVAPKSMRRLVKRLKEEGIFADFSVDELVDLLNRGYPLDPVTLYLLPRISARLAQNERTMFSYLYESDLTGPIRPDSLYHYFSPQMHADAASGGTSKQWLQTESAIAKCSGKEDEVRALQTTCLLGLGLSGERAHASLGLLKLAMAGYAKRYSSDLVIEELIRKNLLLHRRHTDSVSVWHGTDYDIRGRLEEDKARLAIDFDLMGFLQREAPAPSWKPLQYNAEHAISRYFRGVYAGIDQMLAHTGLESMEENGTWLDGKIVYIVPKNEAEIEQARQLARELQQKQLLVAIPGEPLPILDAAVEVQGLLELLHDPDFIARDPLVPVELQQMLDDAQAHMQRLLARLIYPAHEHGPLWFHQGKALEINSAKELRNVLSEICGSVFKQSPIIRNELLNRRHLSRPMVNARKKLISGILEQAGSEKLGLPETEDNTPQASMLRTTLINTGLYCHADGAWRFALPDEIKDQGLRSVWKRLEAFFSAGKENEGGIKDFIDKLRRPPYGVREGVIPILVCAAYRAFPDAVLLLKQGCYMRDVLPSDIEDICATPDQFSVKIFDLSSRQLNYLDRLVSVFTPAGPDHSAPGAVMADGESTVVELRTDRFRKAYDSMGAWKAGLPPAALTAKGVSAAAEGFQQVLQQDLDPELLFFSELPRVMGCTSTEYEKCISRLQETIDELTSVISRYQAAVEASIRSIFALNGKVPNGSLNEIACAWANCFSSAYRQGQQDLVAMRLFSNLDGQPEGDERFIESLALLLVGKTLIHWGGETYGQFSVKLADLVKRIEERAFIEAEANPEALARNDRENLRQLVETRIARLKSLSVRLNRE